MHGNRIILIEAALKHKQAKNGSLGTELAPHAEHKSIEAGCTERAFDALNKLQICGGVMSQICQHSIVKLPQDKSAQTLSRAADS